MAIMDEAEIRSRSSLGVQPTPSAAISTRLLDTVRSVGIGRGTEAALDVLFLRWVAITSLREDSLWTDVVSAVRGGGPGVQSVADLVGKELPAGHEVPQYGSGVLPEFLANVVALASEIGGQFDDGILAVGEAFESVLAGTHRLGKEVGIRETPASIASLLVELAGSEQTTVLDPACGVGNALLSAASDATAIEGVELDPVTARQVWMRLQIAGQPSVIRNRDAFDIVKSLRGRFESVVLHPPWGSNAGKYDLRSLWDAVPGAEALSEKRPKDDSFRWIVLALACLREGGRATVVLPQGTLFPRNSDWHRYLVSQGFVEAIITLPSGGIFSDTSIATAIWVLRRPSATATGEVLFVDAESLVRVTDRHSRVLDSDAVESLSSLVAEWRSGQSLPAPNYVARALDRVEVDLSLGMLPKQYLAPVPKKAIAHPAPPKRGLRALRIENLKSFGSAVNVHLAPLTLIYGANSAGKSSILQSLLLLKQSVRHQVLITQGEHVDVGSFGGLVHRHKDVPVRLGIEYGTLGDWIASTGVPDPTHMRSIEFEFYRSESGLGTLRREVVQFGPHSVGLFATNASDSDTFRVDVADVDDVFQGLASGILLYPFDSRKELGESEPEAARRLKSRQSNARRGIKRIQAAGASGVLISRDGLLPGGAVELPHAVISSIVEREENVIRSYANRFGTLLAGVANEVRCLLDSIVYLGPFRSAPQRFYDRTAVSSRGGDGRQTAMFLFDNSAVVKEVNAWFKNLEIPYTLDVVPVGATNLVGDLVALQLTDSRTRVSVTPSDVGFGLSQMLPIAVELLSRRESIVCVEQPETHLHPRLQARLADLLVHSTNEAGRANQVLVETHSEHLMLRIQRRIREGTLSPEDVSVLYVDQNSAGRTDVKRLRLDQDGDFIDEWPQGFFDERLEEMFGVE